MNDKTSAGSSKNDLEEIRERCGDLVRPTCQQGLDMVAEIEQLRARVKFLQEWKDACEDTIRRERAAPETRAKPAGGAWMIVFDDHEVLPEVFWGEGAEQCAMRAYDQHRTQWSCHLFECIRSTKDDANGGRAAQKANELQCIYRTGCQSLEACKRAGHCNAPMADALRAAVKADEHRPPCDNPHCCICDGPAQNGGGSHGG